MNQIAKVPRRISNNFFSFGNGIYRVGGSEMSLCAYLVETSAGIIQVNTVPELFKTYFPHLKKLPIASVVTAPVVNQLGDTQTGYEFELWTARFLDFAKPHRLKFVGDEAHLKTLYHRLELTMNGDFVHDEFGNKQAKFVERRWVDEVFDWQPTTNGYSIGNVTIDLSNPNGIKIFDKSKLVFDGEQYPVSSGALTGALYVDMLLSQVDPYKFNPDRLGLIVGGNGIGTKPGVTSNFIVFFANRLIWIDPPARCYEKAAQLGINTDYLTDVIITHCHEDHIEGFSGLMQRKIDRKERLSLLSTPPVYEQLKSIFNPFFGDISAHIDFHDLNNRAEFENFHGCRIDIRENYHPIPTFGLKFSYNNRTIGISGDILYSRRLIEARLQNGSIDKAQYDKLSPEWFSDCEILLHDTTLSRDPVHTDLEDLEDLAQEIPHVKVYGYHFGVRFESAHVTPTQFGDRF
jgi:hypothetical protein